MSFQAAQRRSRGGFNSLLSERPSTQHNGSWIQNQSSIILQTPSKSFSNNVSGNGILPQSRPSSRRGNVKLSLKKSLPVILDQPNDGKHKLPRLPLIKKDTKGKSSDLFCKASEHCTAYFDKLPPVNHTPKLTQSKPGELKEIDRIKSKKLKKKVLGSSEANVLPNRPRLITPSQVKSKVTCNNKPAKNKGKVIASSKHSISISKAPLLDKTTKIKYVVPGQVSIQPKIDNTILDQIQLKSCDEEQTAKSPRKPQTPISKKKYKPQQIYSQTQNNLNKNTFPGGPMLMESRSLNRLILKPDVPPSLQIVRRKTKFMENQHLQDIFSIPGAGGRRNLRRSQQNFFQQGGNFMQNDGIFGTSQHIIPQYASTSRVKSSSQSQFRNNLIQRPASSIPFSYSQTNSVQYL